MLVVTRKVNQGLVIGDNIKVKVLSVAGFTSWLKTSATRT